MKRKALVVLGTLLVVAFLVGTVFSGALFTDSASVTNNKVTAGSLVVSVNGQTDGINPFDVKNFAPNGQFSKKYLVKNEGSVTGLLTTMTGISVSETGGLDGIGNLGSLVNIRIFIDKDGDGWIGSGEKTVYNGKIANIPSSLDLESYQLGAGEGITITMIADWWSSEADNDGQSDSLTMNFGFLLKQK